MMADMSRTQGRTPLPDAPPLLIPVARVVGVMTALWALALLVVLLTPAWHEGERHWWPWSLTCGLALGLIGLVVTHRRGASDTADHAAE